MLHIDYDSHCNNMLPRSKEEDKSYMIQVRLLFWIVYIILAIQIRRIMQLLGIGVPMNQWKVAGVFVEVAVVSSIHLENSFLVDDAGE